MIWLMEMLLFIHLYLCCADCSVMASFSQEDQRKREEKDERKRKYNVRWNDEVTAEDMEAYRMKKVHHDDPMKDFLH